MAKEMGGKTLLLLMMALKLNRRTKNPTPNARDANKIINLTSFKQPF